MRISKSLNGDTIKFIVRSGKNVVFRGNTLEEAEEFVAGKKASKKSESKKDVMIEEKPKKKLSFFK